MPILDDIQIKLNFEAIGRKLHLNIDSELQNLRALVDETHQMIHPMVMYEIKYIDEKLDNGVIVEGRSLISEVLRKNLDQVERVFPFVVTIGNKLGDRMDTCHDILEKFYLDTIANAALTEVRKALNRHLKQKYALGKTAFMAPGSLPNWPIEQQKPLFELLGDVQASIGVQLSESLLMLPAKSVSGIYFPTETSFFSCQLCPRERCDSRKAKYSEKLALEYGIKK